MATRFEHNGNTFEIIDGTDEVVLVRLSTSSKGNVVIPKFALYGDKRYAVTQIGGIKECERNEECPSLLYKGSTWYSYEKNGKDKYDFLNVDGITSLIIPNGIKKIGDNAFHCCCRGMTKLTIPDSVTTIGNFAFYGCENLESLTIPDSVTTIGNSAFYGCENLESLTIPDSVTTIGKSAFYGCKNLESLTIPDSVTTIGNSAFSGCYKLESLVVSKNLKEISSWAFNGCRSLKVTIPSSVEIVGENVFGASLLIVDILNDVGEILVAGNAFPAHAEINYLGKDGVGVKKTYCDIKLIECSDKKLAAGLVERYTYYAPSESIKVLETLPSCLDVGMLKKDAESCKRKFEDIGTKVEIIYLTDDEDVLRRKQDVAKRQREDEKRTDYYENARELLAFHTGWDNYYKPVSKYNVMLISVSKHITQLVIPEHIEYDGVQFNVVSIYGGYRAVWKYVNVNSHDKRLKPRMEWKKGGDCYSASVFWKRGCEHPESLKELRPYNDKITSIVIPDSVFRICEYSFSSCKNLKTVKIGQGIKFIEANAFEGCDSLTTVDIYNDPFEVSVGNNAFPPNAKVNYLGKDAAPKDTAKAEKPEAEEPKATTPVTIDLDKLIEAVIADGVITDKERSVIIKKATAAGYDADEVEILLDGKLAEKLSQSIPNTPVVEETKPEAKPEEKTSVIQEEKPATDTVKSEVAKKETSTKSKSKQSSVSYEDYVVTINEDKSISVTLKGDLCDNTKKALREIAELVGFEVDDKWTTRQLGAKLVAFLSEK